MKNAPNLERSLLARQWGATAVPFGEPSPEAWLETPQNQRALALLDQTATLRSVMLLAGPNGVGKSALIGRWLSRLDRRLFHPLPLTHASLSGCGLLSALASKLGQRAAFRRETNLALIETALAELGKVVPLIVLDEAQSFGYGSLEEVRLLLGLNLADPPAFGLVLIGDEYLLGTLRLRQHRSLFSRIACHFSLRPWTTPLVAQYVQQSLTAVGINRPAVEPAALNLLTSASSGLARSLCVCSAARPGSKPPAPARKRSNPLTCRRPSSKFPARPDCCHLPPLRPPPRLVIMPESVPPTSFPVQADAILQAHQLYCQLTGQSLRLGFDRERLWYELLRAGYSLDDLHTVIGYLQREIRAQRRNVGALKLSNLLQPDRFEEDLPISRVRLRVTSPVPSAPPSPPAVSAREQQQGRQRALECLRQIKAALR